MGSDQIIVNADGARARSPVRSWRLLAAAVIAASLVALVGMAMLWFSTNRDDRRFFLLGCGVLFLIACSVGVYWLFVRARQGSIIHLPNGHPLTYRQVAGQSYHFAASSLDQHYAAKFAEASRPNPQLTALHNHTTTTNAAPLPLALPNNASASGRLPTDIWKTALDQCPHLLVFGPSMAGKSTLVQAYITMIGACDYVVLDPQPNKPDESKWNGIDFVTIDPSRTDEFAPIELALQQIEREDERRRRLMGQETFKPLVIAVDEGLMLVDELGWAYDTNGDVVKDSNGRKLSRFSYFVRRMGRSARHRNIKIILIGQGKNLVDLGLTSATDRNNYALLRAYRNAANNERDAFIVTDEGEQPIELQQVPSLAAATGQNAQLWATMQDMLALLATPQAAPPTLAAPPQLPAKPVTPPTLAERIIELLTRQPNLTVAEAADKLGIADRTGKQKVRNEIGELCGAGKLDRVADKGGFRHFVKQP